CAPARSGDGLGGVGDEPGALLPRPGEDRIAQNPPVDAAASGDEQSGHVRGDRRKELGKLRCIEIVDLARDCPGGRDTRTDGRCRLGAGFRVVVDDEGTGPAIAEVGDAERTQLFEERGIEVPSGRVRLVIGAVLVDTHGAMIPALAAVACPPMASSTMVTSTPREARLKATPAPAIPLPMTPTRAELSTVRAVVSIAVLITVGLPGKSSRRRSPSV